MDFVGNDCVVRNWNKQDMRYLMIILLGIGLIAGCSTSRNKADKSTKVAPAEENTNTVTNTNSLNSRSNLFKATAQTNSVRFSITNRGIIYTLTDSLTGTVTTVNRELKFVVLDYSFKTPPPIDQRLTVFRNGKKVGELKVSGPTRQGATVAVILDGEIQSGDLAQKAIDR
jgi:hypothetical protein